MAEREQILKAFEQCLCGSHNICSECYQQGPGLGFVCRNNVCMEVFGILKEQQKEIEHLKAQCGEVKIQQIENGMNLKEVWAKARNGETLTADEWKFIVADCDERNGFNKMEEGERDGVERVHRQDPGRREDHRG